MYYGVNPSGECEHRNHLFGPREHRSQNVCGSTSFGEHFAANTESIFCRFELLLDVASDGAKLSDIAYLSNMFKLFHACFRRIDGAGRKIYGLKP